ncbi:molybdate ABC transporter substrate-binding protein [Alteromonas sp. ASW11-19]|uniref:Molybdate ABC transporter substrate-binding protein n=1 Tax=Alteromonas salexigens TaxID=2982530 RepID=A0ABT2VR90_9ALTE|nr:molybdate ABC transporter substrate-binding protein [Alteromonas salexigens]MCU7555816.1 molybdate ABC transporter substrate-binding protein [Alteromonas salexigens]
MNSRRIVCFVISMLMSTVGHAQTLRLGVAANFAEPLKEISKRYQQQTGITTTLTVGASGTLYAQIQHGAQLDVFLSADSERPQALVESGRVGSDDVMTYAIGRLAYLDRDVRAPGIHDLQTYALAPGTRLAIANPRLAPYGRAAKEALHTLTLWPNLATRLVTGKNVQQAYQFYATGNVDRALVAYSQVYHLKKHVHLIDASLHQPIQQQLAITAPQDNRAAARQFVAFLLSDETQQWLAQRGYQPVGDEYQ